MPKQTSTADADYPVIELAGATRLILGLGDGRMFGVAIDQAPEGELPKLARLKVDHIDEAGVPQGAEFVAFIAD